MPVWAACQAPAAPHVQARGSETTTWRPLGAWSGRGNSQTESFDVTTGAMRVVWKTAGGSAPGAGRFSVSLHSAISGRPLQTPVTHTGAGAGMVYLEDEPRVSYLVIESDQLDWTLTLDEAVAAAAR